LRRLGLPLAALLLGYILCVNLAVAQLGGDPHPVSTRHLPEKSRALSHFALHCLGHVVHWHHGRGTEAAAQAARRHRVPEALFLAIARVESSFDPHAVSRTGAMGVMQLMPATAAGYGARDPFDPEDNVDAAGRYLRELLSRYRGDWSRTAAAYNAGPGRVSVTGSSRLPAETRTYVARVLRLSRASRR